MTCPYRFSARVSGRNGFYGEGILMGRTCGKAFSAVPETLFRGAERALWMCERGFPALRKRLFRMVRHAFPQCGEVFPVGVFLLMRCVSIVWHDALKIVYLRYDVLSGANKAFSLTYGWAKIRARWWFGRFRAMPGHCLRRLVITQPYDVWRRGKDTEAAHIRVFVVF